MIFDSRSCDPGDLRGEALDMVLFSLQDFRRDKHGEVRVLYAHCFDLPVEPICKICNMRNAYGNSLSCQTLDSLPDTV